jgi:hypothetical protein
MSAKSNKPRREAASNAAPPRMGTEPLTLSSDVLRNLRQNRWSPLPYLQPSMLSCCLENYEHGYLRETVLLWERIASTTMSSAA